MAIKVGINGFGRIGRLVFRAGFDHKDIEFVGINDLFPPASLAYLLKYDSIHGRFPGTVEVSKNTVLIDAGGGISSIEVSDSKIAVVTQKKRLLDDTMRTIMENWYERCKPHYVTVEESRQLGVEPELKYFNDVSNYRIKFGRADCAQIMIGLIDDETQILQRCNYRS